MNFDPVQFSFSLPIFLLFSIFYLFLKMLRIISILFFNVLLLEGMGQYNWKVERDKDGIKVYSSEINGADFKAVKVECTLQGTFSKLISILTQVSRYPEWIYNTKKTLLLKKNNALDFIYYTETNFPWPLSNRDAIIHLRINTDSLPKFITIQGSNEPKFVPEIFDKVRVPSYSANWKVTMPTPQTIQINYIVIADPGGNIPSWIGNMFIDKGPYETFKKLSERLVK